MAIWYGRGHDHLLIAFDDPEAALALARLRERAARPDFAAGFARAGVESLPALLAHELWPLGVLHALALEGPLHTLLHPRLAHSAARAFFVGGSSSLPLSARADVAAVGRRRSLARAWAAARGGWSEPERLAFVSELCEQRPGECVTLLAQWSADDPDSPGLAALQRRLRGRAALDQVTPLSRLFAGAGGGAGSAVTVQRAQHEAERFLHYYHHAAPFARSALGRLFDGCASDPAGAEACARSRRSLEGLIGPLADEPDVP